VQFDRNVIALRGPLDGRPDQLMCDTLILSLVPAETPAPAASTADESKAEDKPADGEKSGLFGNLTLQRAYATGHAGWLALPDTGLKLRCNELIHWRQVPYKPDLTYFRGDRTRPLD